MKTKQFFRIITLAVAALIFGLTRAGAQTIEEANELYNQARPLIDSADFKGAIGKLEASLQICDTLGEPAAELKKLITDVLPQVHLNYASYLFTQNLLEESIKVYQISLDEARKYSNKEVEEKSITSLAQLFLKTGNDLYKEKNYAPAILQLKKSLEYDAENTATMLLIAESYRRLDSLQEMLVWYRTTIEKAGKNDKNAPKASERIMGHYMTTGAKLLNSKNTAEGLIYLDSAAAIGQTGDLMYYYAVAYNSQQKYDQAIAAAEKAIALDGNNKENVAKYNFEIGTAWYGKKDNAKACEFYKLANFGRTALRAEPMLKSLKCK
ncbi:MAG TPA: hypothetical protein P5228_00850 [Bacteroidales bacterium]|nr:hypothetical protein [Bacteroidales bacterium]HRZ47909.1 hypothetical protein [Bacteroidales bacterium]